MFIIAKCDCSGFWRAIRALRLWCTCGAPLAVVHPWDMHYVLWLRKKSENLCEYIWNPLFHKNNMNGSETWGIHTHCTLPHLQNCSLIFKNYYSYAQLIIFIMIWSHFRNERSAAVSFSDIFCHVWEERSDNVRQYFQSVPCNLETSVVISLFGKSIPISRHSAILSSRVFKSKKYHWPHGNYARQPEKNVEKSHPQMWTPCHKNLILPTFGVLKSLCTLCPMLTRVRALIFALLHTVRKMEWAKWFGSNGRSLKLM